MKKILTIVTLTKNNPDQLIRTLKSLKKYTKIIKYSKLILIDGSNDNFFIENKKIYKIFDSLYDLLIVKEKGKGIYAAMNTALYLTKSDYLLFMNSGDQFSERFDENLILNKLLENSLNDEINLIYCRAKIKSNINNKLDYFNPAKFIGNKKKKLLPYLVPPSHQACFFKSKWHKKNYYDLDKGYRADRIIIKKSLKNSIFVNTTSSIFNLDGISSLNLDFKSNIINTLKTKSPRLFISNILKLIFKFLLSDNWEYIRYIKHLLFSLIP